MRFLYKLNTKHHLMLFFIPYWQNEYTPCVKIWSLNFIQLSSFIGRTLFYSECVRESISKCRSFARLPWHYGGFIPIKPHQGDVVCFTLLLKCKNLVTQLHSIVFFHWKNSILFIVWEKASQNVGLLWKQKGDDKPPVNVVRTP